MEVLAGNGRISPPVSKSAVLGCGTRNGLRLGKNWGLRPGCRTKKSSACELRAAEDTCAEEDKSGGFGDAGGNINDVESDALKGVVADGKQ